MDATLPALAEPPVLVSSRLRLRPVHADDTTTSVAPVRSSSCTASLTESRFSDLVVSAMMTGL